MDWKIYICDVLNKYLPTLELEELVDLKKKKEKKTSLSAVVHFYSFSTGHIKDQKTSEYDSEIPQSHTADHV